MSIEAMKQTLEALEKYCDQAAIDNMRQVIEQAEKQEPVAWICYGPNEREACAKLCEDEYKLRLAETIRARGDT